MIREIKPTDYPHLIEIWESAVLNTHDFLKEEDFLYYKEQLPVYFQNVRLFGFEQEGVLVGFMGVSAENLEMLFVDNDSRGTGIGKKLIEYAIANLQVTKVDVNEQNTQAVNFYKHIGFNILKRSALDGAGREYPILHMQLLRDYMKPKEVLEEWIRLFNAADAERIAGLYQDDAVNHQVANEPVVGKEAIREMFRAEFTAAEMVCIPENIFEDGEWAILEWRDQLGLRGCGFFHITDGKIKFQRGYWDKLSFLRQYGFPIPEK